MAYDKSIKAGDVADKLLNALRQDKKSIEIDAVIKAEIDQPSFNKAKKQIEELGKDIDVDVDVSKAEKKIRNLIDPLREVSREIKALGSSGADFNVAHNTIKRYEQLKNAVLETTQAIGASNKELREAQNIIRTIDGAIKNLDIIVAKASKKRKPKQAKKVAGDIQAQTDAIATQTDVVKTAADAAEDYGQTVDRTSQKLKEQIDIQREHTEGIQKATRAQQELNKAQSKSLKLKPKKDTDGSKMSGAYATEDGLFEVDHDADGWKVHRKTAAGLYELVGVYKTKNELQHDATLIAEHEAHAQKKAADVMTDAQKKIEQETLALSNAYDGLAERAGHSAKFANQYAALFAEVQRGALSAADAIEKLNQAIDGKIDISTSKQSQDGLVEILGTTENIVGQNNGLISSYKDLYRELEKLVTLSKQLKPTDTDEYEEMARLTNYIGYINNKEEAIAEIKAWYENMQSIKSALKKGLPVYKHVDGSGYTSEENASDLALEDAERTLRGYIVAAVESFGYTLTEAIDDFPKKRMRYFVEDQIEKYYDIFARNLEYSSQADEFNAPIKEQIDTITSGISNMATNIDSMSNVIDTLFNLSSRANDVTRYTLSTEANNIGDWIGIQTPYEEIRMNAKRIETYEELCEVIARFHELQSNAYVYGGKEHPGLDEQSEIEYRTLSARLKLTAGNDVIQKLWHSTQEDIDKLAEALGLKQSRAYETENGNDIAQLVSRGIIDKALKGVDPESLLGSYGLQGDNLIKGVDLFKDLVGASYLGDESPKSVDEIFTELYEFVTANAQRTEEVIKTLQEFREHMKHVQIKIPENMEQTFAADFMDEWQNIKKLYAIGGNSKNKKKLITTSKYASTPDSLMESLLQEGFGYAFDRKMMENFNGSAQDSLRILLDAIQRAKDEFKLPNAQTIFGLSEEASMNLAVDLANAMGIVSKNIAAMEPTMDGVRSSGDAFADSAERAADAIERQAKAAADTVSVEEIIARDMNAALEKLRSSKNNETTLFSLKGVFEGEDLINQAQAMVNKIAEQANLTLSSFNVKDDTIKVKLYNDELKVTVDQMYKLRTAAEDAESATLELTSQSFTQNVKALNENTFDTEGMQKRALASIEKVRSSLHGLEYDLTGLEAAAKSIASQDDFTKFNNQLKATQDNIQAIKNSTVSKNSMNPLANMQRDMQNANIEIETMRLKLEKFGDIQGVKEAKQMLTEMTAAAKQYSEATDAYGQQEAYNQYSNLRSSFKAQSEYINAAKAFNDSQESAAKQLDPVKDKYQSILDLVNKINTANTNILKYQDKDGGSGLFAGYITQLQAEKERLVSELQDITRTIDSTFEQGRAYSIPTSNITAGDNSISNFLNDTRTQAALTTDEIDKLIVSLQKSQTIDVDAATKVTERFRVVQELYKKLASMSTLDKGGVLYRGVASAYTQIQQYMSTLSSDPTQWTPEQNTNLQQLIDTFKEYGNILVEAGQKEAKYFEGKTKYTSGVTTSDMAQKMQEESQRVRQIQRDLENAAKEFASSNGFGDAFITKFAQGADGISKLDFSVFDQASGQLRNFSMEMGSVTDGMYIAESTISKSLSNIKAAQNQLGKSNELIGRVGQLGIGGDSVQVQRLLNLTRNLNAELNKGSSADQNVIANLTRQSKLAAAEVETLYTRHIQLQNAMATGDAIGLGTVDLNADIYRQMVDGINDFVTANNGANVSIGKFNEKAGTLKFSMDAADGTTKEFTVTLDRFGKQIVAQQTGVTQLTGKWTQFKTGLAKTAKQLSVALFGFNIFYRVISEIRKGYGYVKEIDKAMTELKKVTDETTAAYDRFLDTASQRASVIGSTVSDFTEATSNFARLGYTMDESAKMAETAIVYKNVADGLDSVDESTESIISTMKAFGIEADDTMSIIDRFNEVGKILPKSYSNI